MKIQLITIGVLLAIFFFPVIFFPDWVDSIGTYETYDEYTTESLEIIYQNGDIDTIDVKRNTMWPYSLEEGDLRVCDFPIKENTFYVKGNLVKCGVRDYRVLENK